MDNWKEVNFKKYCELCKFKDKKEYESPCNECLEVGMREETEKPEYFEEKKTNADKKGRKEWVMLRNTTNSKT